MRKKNHIILYYNTSSMGNCISGGHNTNVDCWVCKEDVAALKYLRCDKCNQHVHIKCLYSHSTSMNTCLRCDSHDLVLINIERHQESMWSSDSGKSQKRPRNTM